MSLDPQSISARSIMVKPFAPSAMSNAEQQTTVGGMISGTIEIVVVCVSALFPQASLALNEIMMS